MIILLETLSKKVHEAYCANYLKDKGIPYWTKGDYSKLDEKTKEIDKNTVRAIIGDLGFKEKNGVVYQEKKCNICVECIYDDNIFSKMSICLDCRDYNKFRVSK